MYVRAESLLRHCNANKIDIVHLSDLYPISTNYIVTEDGALDNKYKANNFYPTELTISDCIGCGCLKHSYMLHISPKTWNEINERINVTNISYQEMIDMDNKFDDDINRCALL